MCLGQLYGFNSVLKFDKNVVSLRANHPLRLIENLLLNQNTLQKIKHDIKGFRIQVILYILSHTSVLHLHLDCRSVSGDKCVCDRAKKYVCP